MCSEYSQAIKGKNIDWHQACLHCKFNVKCMHTCLCTLACTHTNTHTHRQASTHTQTYTHRHTHKQTHKYLTLKNADNSCTLYSTKEGKKQYKLQEGGGCITQNNVTVNLLKICFKKICGMNFPLCFLKQSFFRLCCIIMLCEQGVLERSDLKLFAFDCSRKIYQCHGMQY